MVCIAFLGGSDASYAAPSALFIYKIYGEGASTVLQLARHILNDVGRRHHSTGQRKVSQAVPFFFSSRIHRTHRAWRSLVKLRRSSRPLLQVCIVPESSVGSGHS